MDFFDKVKDTAANIASAAGTKGKQAYEISCLMIEISKRQSEMKKLYKDMGFAVYNAHKSNSSIEEAAGSRIEKLDILDSEISKLREEIEKIKASEPVGRDNMSENDSDASEAEIINDETDFNEDEVEPIDPIE